jgi:hypothetical protein
VIVRPEAHAYGNSVDSVRTCRRFSILHEAPVDHLTERNIFGYLEPFLG